jgi:hypothetical protein
MCGSCGFPAAPGHWTEAGAASAPDRLRERLRRMKILKKVLKVASLSVHDGGLVPGIQLFDLSGRQVIVQDLEQLWIEAEKLSGKPFDPLNPIFLTADN